MSDPVEGLDNKKPYILEHYKDFREKASRHIERLTHRNTTVYDIVDDDGHKHRFDFTGDVPALALRNIVDTPMIAKHVREIESEPLEGAGNVFFEFDKRTLDDRVFDVDEQYQGVEGLQDADLKQVASVLYEHPDFKLELAGYADRMGTEEYNERLSADRLDVVRDELERFYIERGLEGVPEDQVIARTDQLKQDFATKIKLNTDLKTGFEETVRKYTEDEVREQINRSVSVKYVVPPDDPEQIVTYEAHGEHDTDNHTHTVIIPIHNKGIKEFDFSPQVHSSTYSKTNDNFQLADEGTHAVFYVKDMKNYTVNYSPRTNSIADNTTFLVETEDPGSVTAEYNERKHAVELHHQGKSITINLPEGIEPNFPVGSIDKNGVVSIAEMENRPLLSTTLEQQADLSLAAQKLYDFNAEITDIVLDANHYRATPEELGQRLEEAFDKLEHAGVDGRVLEAYEKVLQKIYADTESDMYRPGELMYPGEVYINLSSYIVQLKEMDLQGSGVQKAREIGHEVSSFPDFIKEGASKLLSAANMFDIQHNTDVFQGLAIAAKSINDELAISTNFNKQAGVDADNLMPNATPVVPATDLGNH